jgi:hypothetical protein
VALTLLMAVGDSGAPEPAAPCSFCGFRKFLQAAR